MEDKTQNIGMLGIGTTLCNGKYRIDQYLASGGFGNTYVAINTTFDEKVAIKELFIKGVCGRSDNNKDIAISLTENQRAFSAHQEKFKKEARRLRKLTNTHIIKVHDLFDENGTSYYVMDYIEGESLSSRLKRTKHPMSESDVMLILPQILDALECVHDFGIWHLDLKPANIMLDNNGNVQLIDFGASKQIKSADGNSLSTSSAITYTQGYAPSEQTDQKFDKFGPWTDLYSLGATLYNLLTMKQPPTPSDIVEDPNKALELPEGISNKTKDLILWLMKPNRKMRPQCAVDIKQFLNEYNQEIKPIPKVPTPPNEEENEDDTILHNKTPEQSEKPSSGKKSKDNIFTKATAICRLVLSKYRYNILITVAAIIVLVLGIILFSKCTSSSTPDEKPVETVLTKEVSDVVILISSGPKNLRGYKYTGELADTIGALPNGEGIAKYEKYDNIPASTYKGRFVDGVCEDNTGNATMTFENGDIYIGTFKEGYFDKGKYTLADGSYFKGTFNNGSPFNGKWYTANGSFDVNVANGIEQ